MSIEQHATIQGRIISLTSRDRYNDYSVVYDYTLEVRDFGQPYGRQWHLGTNQAKARKCFQRACEVVSQHAQ